VKTRRIPPRERSLLSAGSCIVVLALTGSVASAQSSIVTSGFICGMPAPPAGLTYVEIAGADIGISARYSDGRLVASCGGEAPAPPPGLSYVDVDLGRYHAVARLSDGTAVAWGNNHYGQCDVPGLPPGVVYVEVRAGGGHTVARRSDGSVLAWGWNDYYQCNALPLPPGLTYVEIAAGMVHTLARRSDGSVVAWGQNYYGQCDVLPLPPGVTYVEIAAGGASSSYAGHSIARRSDGRVVGWGDNSAGQCRGPALPPGVTYVEIDAHELYSMARRSDGSVVVWGGAFNGERDVPPLPNGLTYTGIAASTMHAAALRSDGTIVAWGVNHHGQCDVEPLPSGLRYVEVAADYGFTVGRYEGCAICDPSFCLGDGSQPSVACPCANPGSPGRGCENSAGTGGALLAVRGSVDPDRIVLGTTGELPSALSVFMQGSAASYFAFLYGDGVRCIGGVLQRIGAKDAVGGAASYPGPGDPSIRARSAALGDPIAPGSFRYYQVYYRDPDPNFCSWSRSTFNASNAVMVRW